LDGKTINLADLRGRIVLLDFWATWCAPCIEEFPHLIAVHEKFAARKDFVMIGISRDFEERVLRDYLKKNDKIKWPQSVGETAGAETACRRFGVTYLPRLFIIGPDGKIIAAQVSGQDVAKRVEQVLKDYDPT
jgi:thiol-disulfide isomerase/thioredoxin